MQAVVVEARHRLSRECGGGDGSCVYCVVEEVIGHSTYCCVMKEMHQHRAKVQTQQCYY